MLGGIMNITTVADQDNTSLLLGYSRRKSASSTVGINVLLVDDDPVVLKSIGRQLSINFNVKLACSAEDAACKLALQTFDVIVTDFDMPQYNGIWLLTQVAHNYPGIRRILFTGSDPSLFYPHVKSGLVHNCFAKSASVQNIMSCF
jgi:DNA-binding NtrC family response regulator